MSPWLWLLLVVGIGAVVLGIAAVADRRSHRRITGAGEPAPMRRIEAVDRHVPAYVTQDEIDALPRPDTGSAVASHTGEGFAFGHASPEFATTSDEAAWDNPRLLIADGAIESIRELLAPLSTATDSAPLIVVAPRISSEVLATLGANRKALGLPVLAALADERDRLRLAELTGATPLTTADLQAGYVPDHALGRAARWSSTRSRCWVAPAAP